MRIGIYGGSFNPVHNGHVHLANELLCAAELDRLIIIPSNISPQKDTNGGIEPMHRINMCRIAFDNPLIEVSDCEIKRGGKSYTFDTINYIKSIYQNSEIYLFMGSDMLLSFHTWFRYTDLLELCTICAISRGSEGYYNELCSYNEEKLSGKARIFDIAPIEISSTVVRNAVANGQDISRMVPIGVAEYIKEHRLYG